MTWNVENPPNPEARQRVIMEWLTRSFQKISDWSKTRSPLGFGGIYLSNSFTPTTPIALTTTFQKISGFDTVISNNQVGVESDVANSRIALLDSGIWVWDFLAVGQFTPFTSNATQTLELSAYNETQGQALLVGYEAVHRDADTFDVSRIAQRQNPGPLVSVGDYVSVWIRQRQTTPQITVNVIDELGLSCFRVG